MTSKEHERKDGEYTFLHRERVIDDLLGQRIVDAMVTTLYNQCAAFPKVHNQYLDAIEKLRARTSTPQNVDRLRVALDQQGSALIFWAAIQGIAMNYQHYINPFVPNCTWEQFDFDDYLRIDLASSMPLYRSAEKYIDNFRKSLIDSHDDLWEAISSYRVYLELDGMRLAHYYGYLAGNSLLPHCIAGYHSDPTLDFAYRHMLETHYKRKLNMDQWEGVIKLADWIAPPTDNRDPQDIFTIRELIQRPYYEQSHV